MTQIQDSVFGDLREEGRKEIIKLLDGFQGTKIVVFDHTLIQPMEIFVDATTFSERDVNIGETGVHNNDKNTMPGCLLSDDPRRVLVGGADLLNHRPRHLRHQARASQHRDDQVCTMLSCG